MLEAAGRSSPPADRALARDLALGVVQRLNTLDWALAPLVTQPLDRLEAPVRAALRLGAYQLLFAADRFPAYAALNETVGLAASRARGFVNAVLRACQRRGPLPPFPADAVEGLALRHSYPAWLVKRWTDRWGEKEAGALMAAGNAPAPLTLRANRLKTTPWALAARLKAEGRDAVPTSLSPDGVRVEGAFSLADDPGFRGGDFSVQDEAAQWAVHALDPLPGDAVLDLCAGVGGKTGHIMERLAGRGRVTAVDTDARRLALLIENAARLGLADVEAVAADAADPSLPAADRVLVDAPCSGLGTIRRRPDIKWARREEDVRRLPDLQKRILFAGAERLKPGGRLVYATCTTEPEENEHVACALAAARPDLSIRPSPGPASGDGFLRLRPDLHGTDGFFIAVFERKT